MEKILYSFFVNLVLNDTSSANLLAGAVRVALYFFNNNFMEQIDFTRKQKTFSENPNQSFYFKFFKTNKKLKKLIYLFYLLII